MENRVNDPFEDMPNAPDEWTPPEPDSSPEEIPLTRLTKKKPKATHPWMLEFYPITALKAALTNDELVCAKHSLLKWQGLQLSNLEKHNVVNSHWYSLKDISDGLDVVVISGYTCALCELHIDRDDDENGCLDCIITEVDEYNCSAYDDEGSTILTPWRQWTKDRDPGPMINLLEECVSTLLGREHACPICSRNCYCKREGNVCMHMACVHWDDENQIA
jgi:hypothetical protein